VRVQRPLNCSSARLVVTISCWTEWMSGDRLLCRDPVLMSLKHNKTTVVNLIVVKQIWFQILESVKSAHF
jgi:hypothetical protein